MPSPHVTVIIPARYQSSRFPGKPLALIDGRPMVCHVHDAASRASLVNRVIVATDDQRIFEAVAAEAKEVVMTSPDHPSGTDRLAEVAAGLDSDIIVNVQGDEPLIHRETIDGAIQLLLDDPGAEMGTVCRRIEAVEDLWNPNVVKVVFDGQGNALYFSRSPIPFHRDLWGMLGNNSVDMQEVICYKHMGLYSYRRDFLLRYAGLSPARLENIEKLEQLRVLENGCRIKVAVTPYDSIGVDSPADLERVRELFLQNRRGT
ncbi:MAG: 3-deoxy-manno-octulosonate cytidylyltransferase [Nitrospirota bacterium]|nr:3-deoxy-manno-octulosonate cytidylyltransferase [Nitrospirota bacterium]